MANLSRTPASKVDLISASEDARHALLSAAGRMCEFCRCGNNGAGDCDACLTELDLRFTAQTLTSVLSEDGTEPQTLEQAMALGIDEAVRFQEKVGGE